MLYFYLRRAIRSLRRTPVMSSVMVVDMALGLAIWIVAYSAVVSHRRDPLPDSSAVFHVDWGTKPAADTDGMEGYQRVLTNAPHQLLSYRDAKRLSAHPAVASSAKTFTSRLSVKAPGGRSETSVRFSTRELFAMFELEFEHGSAWDAAAERSLAPVVVLDHATNSHFFGGTNSVGRTLEIDGQGFGVVGVLAEMPRRVRGYDFTFTPSPSLYMPLELFVPLAARPDFLAHHSLHGTALAELVISEDAFLQLWVTLPTDAARQQYAAFLRTLAAQRKPALPVRRAMLVPLALWLERNVAIPNGFFMFGACAFLALLACSVNLSRLLIVKFQARAQELAVQRALGATQVSVFAQHMLEALLIALAAVALALLIAWLGLFGINGILPDRPAEFALDATGVLLVCAAGLGLGLLAGMPAAWRMCRTAPAALLRLQ